MKKLIKLIFIFTIITGVYPLYLFKVMANNLNVYDFSTDYNMRVDFGFLLV